MRFSKVIIVLLTISFSAFLINRSCHDNTGVDPDTSGGISQMIRKPEEVRVTTASSPAPSPEERVSSKEMAVKELQRIERREEKREETARVAPWSVVPFSGIQREYSRGATNTAATEEAARKLHGTWVLTDGNTNLQLTVVNNTGSLRGEISEAGGSFRIEQEVLLFADYNTVYVYSSKPRNNPSMDMIMLAFNFKEDGSAQVVWVRRDQSTPLTVVSHVR